MADHSKRRPRQTRRSRATRLIPHAARRLPALPDNRKRRTGWRSINSQRRNYVIEDEIIRVQFTNRRKALYLQKLRCETDGAAEFRLGYYMIGVKPRMAGRWTWGQFAPLIPARDFRAILRKARTKGWF